MNWCQALAKTLGLMLFTALCTIIALYVWLPLLHKHDRIVAEPQPVYCETIQQPDGTIVDRPCAKGEKPNF